MDRLEFKFVSEELDSKTGEFAGYGAIFGNVDSHGDVVEPGAFSESLKQWAARGALPIMKLMHGSVANPFTGSDLPIGKWKAMREDARGLHVEGKLSGMDTDLGRYHFSLMQDGALSGLSIGYKVTKVARGEGNIKRRLQTVGLSEVSLVPEGSNDQAVITHLKSRNLEDLRDRLAAGDRLSDREWDRLLTKGLDLSNAEAERAVRINLKGRGAPGDTAADDVRGFYEALRV